MKMIPWEEILQRTSPEVQRRAKERSRELMAEMLLVEIRKRTGKSQPKMAAELGVRQPKLSELKNYDDLDASTFEKLVTALGGKLDVTVRFPKTAVHMDQLAKLPKPHRKGRSAKKVA